MNPKNKSNALCIVVMMWYDMMWWCDVMYIALWCDTGCVACCVLQLGRDWEQGKILKKRRRKLFLRLFDSSCCIAQTRRGWAHLQIHKRLFFLSIFFYLKNCFLSLVCRSPHKNLIQQVLFLHRLLSSFSFNNFNVSLMRPVSSSLSPSPAHLSQSQVSFISFIHHFSLWSWPVLMF